MSEFAKYMIRRELLNTGLTEFDDRPEHYRSWRATFRAAIKNLDIEPMGELDLLIKWLGPKSSEQARLLKSVNIEAPARGLIQVWERLERDYGSPEVIERTLLNKFYNFPSFSSKDNRKLQELSDFLLELETAKLDPHLPGLCCLDTAYGLYPITEKLPQYLKDKWNMVGAEYKSLHQVLFPPFSFFCGFIRKMARVKNDPSFLPPDQSHSTKEPATWDIARRRKDLRKTVSVRKTGFSSSKPIATPELRKGKPTDLDPNLSCPIHNKPHPLRKCRVFREKPFEERKTFLKDHNICYRCCASSKHFAKDCKAVIKCSECNSDKHVTANHSRPSRQAPSNGDSHNPSLNYGGESAEEQTNPVSTKCTEVCGKELCGRSCAKICLVKVAPVGHPEKAVKMYVILDDQSNKSLASPKFFKRFNIQSEAHPYTLRTCAGQMSVSGRTACGFQIASIDNDDYKPLPVLIECAQLPNNREEIPTPNAARHQPHLKGIADKIPPLDESAEILILLGRDIPRVHKVQDQTSGPSDAPYAQKLELGWVLIGEVCLDRVRKPYKVNTCKTDLMEDRGELFGKSCSCHYQIRPKPNTSLQIICGSEEDICYKSLSPNFGGAIFHTTCNDNKIAPSIEDKEFIKIMDKEFVKDDSNSWTAPLPFRSPRVVLPNNSAQAKSRFDSLKRTLGNKPIMREHFVAFMKKILDNNHAEPAPPLKTGEERWYLPSFGVYHPRKPGQIRVVFDSSAQFKGVSLNNVLLTGPNLTNSLIGVLVRFRKERVAFMADVQQMFHCFLVREDHRNYLRFLWHRNNDLDEDVIEYRMRVHVFGNSPSPAVATYGLRRTAKEGEAEFGHDVRQFIERDFYVDDCLKSLSTPKEAINLLKRTQHLLSSANLRLHKIVSNNSELMKAFDPKDHASDLKDLDLTKDLLPTQRSLGLHWDVNQDTFTFQVSTEERPFTRRGVLSTVNSLYDPLGFVAPITVQGKLILRQLTEDRVDWDVTLPADLQPKWEKWKLSLKALEQLQIPRNYLSCSLSLTKQREIHIFCDASNEAVAAVAYLKASDSSGQPRVGFVLGRTKLAPKVKQTIPRLELCGAVLAIEIADFLQSEIDIDVNSIKLYTDSKVVLGYIFNTTRRFYVYVTNRVERIRKSSKPEQWNYVPTDLNPADIATRPVSAAKLADTCWFSGPEFLRSQVPPSFDVDMMLETTELINNEVCQETTVLISQIQSNTHLGTKRFERFSMWKKLTHAIALLIHVVQSFRKLNQTTTCHKWHICDKSHGSSEVEQAELFIIRCVQEETFSRELKCLKEKGQVSSKNLLLRLHPIKDDSSMLRVGGRLDRSTLLGKEQNPLILPGKHYVTTLLIQHYHSKVRHQGRHYTEGALREAGLWIIGARRAIAAILHRCVKCKKLRGKQQQQLMASLPMDRLSMEPPFTYVGCDMFGPWTVVTRKTRGGQANNKRWAAIFTCLSIRAVHIEVVESMDTSSFINALRRFLSIRGPVKLLRSDCGTNFVGACRELQIEVNQVEEPSVNSQCEWRFNPPHSSHMGGAWERMIGMARRILDSILLDFGSGRLTHETLTTFLAEVTSIINSRPLVPVSSDPDFPVILTPATLLTQKTGLIPTPPEDFNHRDLYKSQWRRVQLLANCFWGRWRKEYVCLLQGRRKWQEQKPNLQEGDLVLLKDQQTNRIGWPMAVITKAVQSEDGRVRKVEVKTTRDGVVKTFFRPVTETVLLLPLEHLR